VEELREDPKRHEYLFGIGEGGRLCREREGGRGGKK
jgi:hypothetical protein